MKKIFLLFIAFSIFAVSCGEAGFESDISKTSEVEYNISVADVSGTSMLSEAQSFDFADADFSEYVADAKKFTLDKLEYEISGLTGTSTATLNLEVRIDFQNNTGSSTDGDALLTMTGVTVANTTGPVLLYNTDATNPGLANASVVVALEQAILSGQAVEIEVTASKIGPDLTEDFVFKLLFDLTARVQLDD
jgi:hypothetical protein